MAEATETDLRAAEQALHRIMHFARLTLHAMENVGLSAIRMEEPQQAVVLAVESALETILRGAKAAGDKLTELKIGPKV